MDLTFPLRRYYLHTQKPGVLDIKEQYPFLFTQEQVGSSPGGRVGNLKTLFKFSQKTIFTGFEDYVHKSGRYINSDKELFIAHTQDRMKNLVGKSVNRADESTPDVKVVGSIPTLAKKIFHSFLSVVGPIPTLANKIFHSFLSVCDEQFFIRILALFLGGNWYDVY